MRKKPGSLQLTAAVFILSLNFPSNSFNPEGGTLAARMMLRQHGGASYTTGSIALPFGSYRLLRPLQVWRTTFLGRSPDCKTQP